jgi:ParB/RepB/Spo0J family partition protein
MPSSHRRNAAEVLDQQMSVVTPLPRLGGPGGERFNSAAKFIELHRIKPNPQQPRKHFDAEALEELAASVRQDGVLQPIVVRSAGDGYQIIMGERRYRAAVLAGLEEVPVLIREMDDEDAFLAALVENLQRANLDPADEADAYQGLLAKGYSARKIAERLGVAPSKVSRVVRVYEDSELAEAVSDGLIRKSEAEELLVVPREERPRLVQFIAGRRKEKQPLKISEVRSEVKAANPRYTQDVRGDKASSVANRNTLDNPSYLDSVGQHLEVVRQVAESRPVAMWEPEVAAARRVIEDAALKVSGKPWTEGSVTDELALESALAFERGVDGWLLWLGDRARSGEIRAILSRIRTRLEATGK